MFRNETSRIMDTGIPPYVVLSHRMHELEAGVRNEIRGFHDEIKRIPEAVTTGVLNQCEVNGAILLTEQRMNGIVSLLRVEIRAMREEVRAPCPSNDAVPTMEQRPSHTWSWGGRLHMVPQDFRLPKVNTSTLWNLYWGGRAADRIGPF